MASAVCAVCLRSLSTTATGKIRTHGPLSARCPGSGKPPRTPSTSSVDQPKPMSPSTATPRVSPNSTAVATIPKVRVLCRIPRSARQWCSSKLATILEGIVQNNSIDSWNRLLLFATSGLRQPHRGKHTGSLSTIIKRQIQEESSPASIQRPGTRSRKQARKRSDPLQDLGRRVTAKIEEGDLRGAITLACSDELLADFSDDTFNALKAKHPPAHPDSDIPPCPVTNQTI